MEEILPFNRTMSHPPKFPEFHVAEMLPSKPTARTEHSENQAKHIASRPQQEQAEQGKQSGDSVKRDHDLPMRKPTLQKFVMNMLTVRSKNWPAAEKAPNNGQRSFEYG